MVSLLGARATKIEVINNLTEAKEISIEIVHEFNVNYAADEAHCRGILQAGIKLQGQPEILTVLCTVIGDFAIPKVSTEEDKKRVHIECYYSLFPYAQSLIMRLCTDAGLPPFCLPIQEMKEENIIVNS